MKLRTRAYILVLIILVQHIAVILSYNRHMRTLLVSNTNGLKNPFVISIIINILTIASIVSLYYIIKFLQKEKGNIIKFNNSKEVITALQGQKHDFRNHLNVLAGMLQLDKKDKALDYIFGISDKVEEVFSISRVQNIEIAATLFRKCAIAENKGIFVDLDIRSDLQYMEIDSVEACKIIFNLIDNAIYELERCKKEDTYLMIDIFEEQGKYVISIRNSYPVLSPDLYDKIFERGFTTKGSKYEHGYGLSIVKRMVEKNNGTIAVESFEGVGTSFTVRLPMKTTKQRISYDHAEKLHT